MCVCETSHFAYRTCCTAAPQAPRLFSLTMDLHFEAVSRLRDDKGMKGLTQFDCSSILKGRSRWMRQTLGTTLRMRTAASQIFVASQVRMGGCPFRSFPPHVHVQAKLVITHTHVYTHTHTHTHLCCWATDAIFFTSPGSPPPLCVLRKNNPASLRVQNHRSRLAPTYVLASHTRSGHRLGPK